MFNLKHWLNLVINFQEYIWIKALLVKETPKAILIVFDGKKKWLPKARILKIRRDKEVISIKISQYHWAKKAK